jgi:addiction module RelE/StbE family toxin
MQNLKFTKRAENDLFDVFEYIAQDNPIAAYEVHAAILETCQKISEQPDIAAEVSKSAITGLRRAVVSKYPNYLIFYKQVSDYIEILRLGEGHRDWDSLIG